MLVTPPFDLETLLRKNLCCSCSLVARQAWAEVGGYDETFRHGLEDWDFWLSLCAAGYSGAVLAEPLVTYVRKHHSMLDTLHRSGGYQEAYEHLRAKHADLYATHWPDFDVDGQEPVAAVHGMAWQFYRYFRTMHLRFELGRRLCPG